MTIESECVADLAANGYHPRSSRHSDFLSKIIIRDLVAQCDLLRERAAKGEIVANLKHHQRVEHADWVIDIAIGTCAGSPAPPITPDDRAQGIRSSAPVIIQIAIELKSIFTEHGKARLNRLRDFGAFHGYAHEYDPKTVAAAFLEVNASRYFYSPLRRPEDITEHGTGRATARDVAQSAIAVFRSIHLRNSVSDGPGLEAIGVIAIEHDNLAFHPTPSAVIARHQPTRVAPSPPSVPVGDPLYYQSMIQRICSHYTQRFS
jgi:hypothetical protein